MILVTGGTGLVGAQLLYDLLQEDKKVRALRRPHSTDSILEMIFHEKPSLKNNIEWVKGDVTNVHDVLEAMQGIEEVYHLSLIHISEPTRLLSISYAVFCLK